MELCTGDLVKNVDLCIRRNEMDLQNELKEVRYELNKKIPLEGSDETYDEQQLLKAILIFEKRKGWR